MEKQKYFKNFAEKKNGANAMCCDGVLGCIYSVDGYFACFQMCPCAQKNSIKAFYVAEDITEIELPSDLQNLPELGDNPESGVIGYIIIANGE